jgi:hypothetical protein
MGLIDGLSLGLIFWCVFSVLCVAILFWVGLKFALPLVWEWNEGRPGRYRRTRDMPDYKLSVFEIACCFIFVLGFTLPSASWIVHKVAVSAAVDGYHEYLNGNLIAAPDPHATRCEKDGWCEHTYQCDLEYHDWDEQVPSGTDSKGNTIYTTIHHHDPIWHSCPYATWEYDYWVTDSLHQKFTLATNVFADDPQEWRDGSGIPGDVPRGAPQTWRDAKAAIERGDNPPTVMIHDYTNYLLAAQDSVLQAYSDKIDQFRDAGLLPDDKQLATAVHGVSTADKVVFQKVNVNGDVNNAWQDAVNHLNSQLGSELQGDLHVVVVPASEISSPADYATALLADWQSRRMDKEGLAKNAILLVIGVSADGKSVEWTQAKTGIPEGNGPMLVALSNDLDGKAFDPVSLIGRPTAHTDGDKVAFTPSKGQVEQIVLRDYPFQRPCMMCKDKDDHGLGYVYLKDSALLPGWAEPVVVICVDFVMIVFLTVMMFIDFDVTAGSWLRTGLDKFQSRRKFRRGNDS